MYNNSTIKDEQISFSQINLNSNDDIYRNDNKLELNNEINSYNNYNILKIENIIRENNSIKKEDTKKIIDIISRETLNITKNDYPFNKNKNEQNSFDINIYVTKEVIIDKDRFTIDSLIRRAKKILFDTLLKYDNYVISKVYNNRIGNGLKIKKLLKINHLQIKNTNTNFNRGLLKTSQGTIFSSDISARHSNYPLDHNKILIKSLLNEENEEKRKIFNDLFSKSFSDCINHLIGKIKYNCFEGIEEFYEKELTNLEENENFKEILKKVINDYEKIFKNKKPRKAKLKK